MKVGDTVTIGYGTMKDRIGTVVAFSQGICTVRVPGERAVFQYFVHEVALVASPPEEFPKSTARLIFETDPRVQKEWLRAKGDQCQGPYAVDILQRMWDRNVLGLRTEAEARAAQAKK